MCALLKYCVLHLKACDFLSTALISKMLMSPQKGTMKCVLSDVEDEVNSMTVKLRQTEHMMGEVSHPRIYVHLQGQGM